MIKLRKMRWAGNGMADMGVKRNAGRTLVRKSEGKRPLGDLGLDGRIILK
jgi:hypothetical protein